MRATLAPSPAPSLAHSVVFRTTPASVPAVRGEARSALTGWGPLVDPDTLDSALLIVTELVGNTVKHAARLSPSASLGLSLAGGRLAIEVHDHDPGRPRTLSAPYPDMSGGWGMRLVVSLVADAGGTLEVTPDPAGAGKTVRVGLPL